MQTDTINELAEALAKAQGEIQGATKDTDNPFFKSKYADLAAVWDACRSPLSKNGLSVVQQPRAFESQLRLVTRLMHSSGQWIEDEGFPLLLTKQDMQGLGSATTYARRYGLMAAVGIAPEEDDGNAASKTDGSGKGAKAVRAEQKAPPKDHGENRGPLGIVALKDALKEFNGDLAACGDADELIALLNGESVIAILEQCTRDLPGWYYTKPGTDVLGIEDRINARRAELDSPPDQYGGAVQ